MIIKPCCPAPLPLAELWVRRAGPAKLWIWWLAGLGWAAARRCCTGRGLRQDCGHTGDSATPARPRPAAGGRDTGRARPLHYSYDMRSMCSAPPARSCTHSCSWTHRAIWQLPSCRHRPAPAVSQDSTRHWWSSSCLKHHLRKYFHIADYAASKYFLCSTLDSTLDWLRFWAATLRREVFALKMYSSFWFKFM